MVEGEHLSEEAKELLKLSDYDRFKSLEKDIWVEYPVAERILSRMRELYYHARCNRMPNLLIIGPTNNGKSMIKEKFYKIYNRPFYENHINLHGEHICYKELIEQPLISIQMPSNPNIRRFLIIIGEKIGQNYQLTNRNAIEEELFPALIKLKVRMIIIDEVHNILAGSTKQQLEFLNTLRYIGNELKVPIVCLGTRDAYLALRTDPQLENRFEPCILPLWQNNREFMSLLESFITIIPLRKHSNLICSKIASFILKKSEGIIGEISAILRNAARKAIESGREQIDLEILEELDYKSPGERRLIFEKALL